MGDSPPCSPSILGDEDAKALREAEEVEERERMRRVRDAVSRKRAPTTVQDYSVHDSALWNHRHIPAGSVLVCTPTEPALVAAGKIAVLVMSRESHPSGIWLEVKAVGCETQELRSKLGASFRGFRKHHHICLPDPEGQCQDSGEAGVHLEEFRWYPPGEFESEWVSRANAKLVKAGLEMEKAERDQASRKREEGPGSGPSGAPSNVEKRLEELKSRQSGRVSFAPDVGGSAPSRAAEDELERPRVGALRRGGTLSSAPALRDHSPRVKREIVVSDTDNERKEKKKHKEKTKKGKGVSDVLAKAVAERLSRSSKEEDRRRRSRSGSRRSRRKRRRSRRRSDSKDSSGRTSSGEDSSVSLQPPLKKKAMKEPGSVFKMLLSQAATQLAQEGLELEEPATGSAGRQKVRLYTFYQLALKPALDPKSRDNKELALLAKALDLLQDGDVTQLADLLAARMVAVDTATRQGWGAAKYLELQSLEDDGTAPPHILLAALKHSRQVEKAGGKGSWARSQSWGWEWPQDGKGRGKGKDKNAKGKKGKAKGKGGKGHWNAWGASDKEKPAEAKPAAT